MSDLIRDLRRLKPYLFWDIGDPEDLSEEALVEIVPMRGDFDDISGLAWRGWLISSTNRLAGEGQTTVDVEHVKERPSREEIKEFLIRVSTSIYREDR